MAPVLAGRNVRGLPVREGAALPENEVTVYIHRMVRTQLFLDEATHARLRALARKQGRTVSDLVREAVDRMFGHGPLDDRERTLKGILGLWRGRSDIDGTRAYVRSLRKSTRRNRLGKPPSGSS